MKIAFFLVLIYVLFNASVFAQQTTLSGTITDAQNGEHLIGATVYALEAKRGTVANRYGHYSLVLPKGKHTIRFSYVGYQFETDTLVLALNQVKNVELNANALLKEIEITAKAENIEEIRAGSVSLSAQTIKEIPTLFGQPDVLRALQLIPGVKMGQEGSTGLHVRGGSPDQNLILLDGIPVYNTQHLFSFISVFNPDAVQKVDLLKSSIPAQYGGRLSSVLDIQLKEGNSKEKKRSFTLAPLASSYSYEAPIKKKGAFIIAARRSWLDLLTTPIIAAATDTEEFFAYNFYDLSAKANWKLDKKNRIYASFYTNRDKFSMSWRDDGDVVKINFKWGNELAIFRWNRIVSPQVFSNLSAFYSNYRYNRTASYKTPDDYYAQKSSSKIRELGIKWDWEANPHWKDQISWGIKASALGFNPEITEFKSPEADTTYIPNPTTRAVLLAGYVQNDWKINSVWELQTGLRATYFIPKDDAFFKLAPRFSLKYSPNKQSTFHISYNYMMQYINLLTNSSIGLPTDLWLPSTSKIPPQLSWQISTGSQHLLKGGKFQLSVDAYYKKFFNLIEYKEGNSFLYGKGSNWEDKVAQGDGEAYGVELFIKKQQGKLRGWFGYTLAWSNRNIPEVNQGKTFPYKYDRRHDVSLWLKWSFTPKKFISSTWVYSTGNAITLPIGVYNSPEPTNWTNQVWAGTAWKENPFDTRTQLGDRNSYRMNAYHRLDVSFQTSKTNKKGRERTWIFSVYNSYNQLNPYFLYYSQGKLKQVSLFPSIPSVAYRLDF